MDERTTDEAATNDGGRRRRGVLGWAARFGLLLLILPVTVLGALALYWSNLPLAPLRIGAAAGFAGAMVMAPFVARSLRRAVLFAAVLFAAVLGYWLLIPAKTNRDWAIDAARQATAQIDGSRVTIRDFRDFVWRTETDFDPVWTTRTVDLDAIEGVDFMVSSWGMDAIAHTFLSFRFVDADPVCISIEVRKEKDESYHPLPGMFRQYELIYQVGSEHDFIGVRVNQRGERVHLYPTHARKDQARNLLVSMLEECNELAANPAFYRSIGRNCTTALVRHVDTVLLEPIPWTKRVLLNGYSPEYAAELGLIDPPGDTEAHCVNDAAAAATGQPDFSRRIRGG